MAKKELDNLSRDMIECEKAGYGCHYGRWKAAQTNPAVKKEDVVPKGWKKCAYCGKLFKGRADKKYCEDYCRNEAYKSNPKKRAYEKAYRERKKQNG